jgi:hypothetical protein
MAFSYVTGSVATIAEFFTVLEEFLTLRGWSTVSGTGTTDLVVNSTGEDQNYTKLYARIWEVAGTVRIEVRDDAVGTNETTRNASLNFAAMPADYYINGDADFINICIRTAAPVWTLLGFGACYTLNALLADEAQRMCVISSVGNAANNITMLQNYLGGWDWDCKTRAIEESPDFRPHPVDGSLVIAALYINLDQLIYGQVPHLTGNMWAGTGTGVAITTADGTRETTWITLQDLPGIRFAMRTGGRIPIGVESSNFAYETGRANIPEDFIETIIPAFMVGLGWTNLGDPGFHTYARLYYSQGESGADDIYVIVSWNAGANDFMYIYVQNDAVGTQRTTAVSSFPDISNFPLTYHLCGDRDCLMITHSYVGTEYNMLWGGKVRPAHPNMDCTYHMVTYGNYLGGRRMLRDCDGNWNQLFTLQNDGTGTDPSSPSQIDAYMTYPVWPYWVRDNPAGGGRDMVGQLKYFYSVQHDGRASDGDFYPIEDNNYRLFSATGLEWAMRVA